MTVSPFYYPVINRFISEQNDLDDFRMPYQIYSKFDKELMQSRYNSLTNEPKHYFHVRLRWSR